MSKIYEALEHARDERLSPPDDSLRPPSVVLPERGREAEMEDEMVGLYQTIIASLPNCDHPSVLFTGSRSNEGTSTIARQLAKAVSHRLEKNVLLIDLDRSRPDLHVYMTSKKAQSDGIGRTKDSIEEPFWRVEESSLYVMPLFERTMVKPGAIDTVKTGNFWEPLKQKFELIIVDSPPASMFPDGPGVVSQVDGVILVVEAERTRWQVALAVKEKIVKHGGNILGIVFNKRRYYIPRFLYRYLLER
jgi:Mrp family chromosome partitioning ATPase